MLIGLLVSCPFIANCQTFSNVQITKFEDDAIANVYAIEMDNQHFLWLATQNGIFRFDSRSFEKIPVKQRNGTRAEWTAVRSICYQPASNQLVVMSPDKGLAILMRHADSLHFREINLPADIEVKDISSLIKAGDHFALLTRTAVLFFEIKSESTSTISIVGKIQTPYLCIDAVTTDTVAGISDSGRIDLFWQIANNQWSSSQLIKGTQSIRSSDEIFSFAASGTRYYVGTNRGLLITHAEGTTPVVEKRFKDTAIYAIATLPDQTTAIASSLGLYMTNARGEFERVVTPYTPENHTWFNATYTLFADPDGNLWLGTQNGLAMIKERPNPFIRITSSNNGQYKIGHAYHIYKAADGRIYISASNGLSVANKDLTVTNLLPEETYFLCFEGPGGQLLVSDRNNTYVLAGNKLVPCSKVFPELSPFQQFSFNDVEPIGDSCLLLSTENNRGLVLWNFKRKRARAVGQNAHPAIEQVNSLYQYKEQVYVLTDNFIYRYYPATDSLHAYRLHQPGRSDYFALLFDMLAINDRFYISSYGSGVIETNLNFEPLQAINEKKGLTDNGTYKLFATDSNTIFVSTNHGINIIHLNPLKIESLTTDDGLHGNLFEEFSGQQANGLLYFGGKGGITIIDPKRLDIHPNIGYFVFTNYTTVDNRNLLSTYSLLDREAISISRYVTQTTLYFQNIIYPGNKRIRYAYRIDGISEDWIDLGHQNFLNLIGLPPGTYLLRVRSTDDQGNWLEPATLSISFQPKWHQTWWFKLILLSLALGSIYVIYRVRINQLKQTQAIRTKLASDLHDDLGSTLNSVKVYANLSLMEKAGDKNISKVKESIQEAITGLRDMIWVLDDRKDSMEDLANRIRQFAAPLCEASGVQYIEDFENAARAYRLNSGQKRNLYMILKEAINNALKYADATEVRLSLKMGRKYPEISCCDNGHGFDSRLITPGNGLVNMQRRANELQFKLDIESTPGKGTCIKLQKR